jgi:hypothetical protein
MNGQLLEKIRKLDMKLKLWSKLFTLPFKMNAVNSIKKIDN